MPTFPVELSYLWKIFARLRHRKGGSGFGPSPIEWVDMRAFSVITKIDLAPWEVEMIEYLDNMYMATLAGQKAE